MEWGAGIWGLTLRRNREGKGNWLAQEGSRRAGQCPRAVLSSLCGLGPLLHPAEPQLARV